MAEPKSKGRAIGDSPTALTRTERLGCIGDLCVSDDGKEIELHLDGSKPECAKFTELLGPKVLMGMPTRYIVDAPGAPDKASPARRKG